MRIWHNIYSSITTLEAIFQALDEFIEGKKKKTDVVAFTRFLEDNLFDLQQSLKEKTYRHGSYKSFYIRDPKVRHISKACVKDRVVHHLVSSMLEKIFDPTFYVHSYSCRKAKGAIRLLKLLLNSQEKQVKTIRDLFLYLNVTLKSFLQA